MAPSATPAKKAQKKIFKADTPFTATKWPQVSPGDHDIILDMLCNLLAPLGHHRKTHIHPSKGRSRNRKRKRTEEPTPAPPPAPPLSTHLTIGLNSTTRHLESLAAISRPSTLNPPAEPPTSNDAPRKPSDQEPVLDKEKNPPSPLAVIVLPHPHPPSSLTHAHIPTMTYVSSLSFPSTPPPRLVLLSSSSEARLANALHLPRVGALGIMEGAPGADALIQYCREKVGVCEVPWIEEGMKGEWKGLNMASE